MKKITIEAKGKDIFETLILPRGALKTTVYHKKAMYDLLTEELDSIVADLYGHLEHTPTEIDSINEDIIEVLTDILNEHKGEK